MSVRVGLVSLGCSKNQVDAERMLYKIREAGYQLVSDAALADIAIINTCGFIESAKQEAIETIFEFAALKNEGRIKKIVITGCLAERYREEVAELIPEADAVVGIGCNDDIVSILGKIITGEASEAVQSYDEKEKLALTGGRVQTTLSFTSYLKIAEGCDNCCSYCAIPSIRGRFRSVPMEELVKEAEKMVVGGVRELILIAQDTTRYGIDLYGEYRLPQLLKKLCEIDELKWIRVLYCYPERVTDELLDVMATEEKIVKYMDLPIQHCDGEILKKMNRRGDEASLRALIKKIREKVPGITLRTTLITGFPGESEEQFGRLAEFVNDMKFDRLGCFAFSPEEGTPAAEMEAQLDEDVKERRAEVIMDQQMMIAVKKNKALIGETIEIVIEGFDRYGDCYFGRSAADAPEIDGKIFFTSGGKKQVPGKFVKVKITDMLDYDLIGELEE
ncbi:MAG: 30S ribosomal protein S12 methylthiotransferase RimO [Oscillospiraceae bacterium]|nr:30S ribosomal protein S12 methylthiotransferase RimO [Oscillospiraceae bacterium]MDE6132453.1 30S ribosomal protein S12 methylthiotransferase RimO [Oscillospiraceae bacterium]